MTFFYFFNFLPLLFLIYTFFILTCLVRLFCLGSLMFDIALKIYCIDFI
uniref:Uncharacterized protein n=1 Tax=Ciona intestinalis TaxID=7719 RepID=H2XNC8_CIOIN